MMMRPLEHCSPIVQDRYYLRTSLDNMGFVTQRKFWAEVRERGLSRDYYTWGPEDTAWARRRADELLGFTDA